MQIRGPRLVENVLQATLEELGRVGYGALAVEAVAARANVNKTTIYRRWPSKQELVVAALDCARPERSCPDTGTLRGDLLALVDRMNRDLTLPWGRAIVGRMLADDGPELAALLTVLRTTSSKENAPIVQRAIARGEIPAGTHPTLIVEVVMAATLQFTFFMRDPTPWRSAQVVDLVLAGAVHGGAVFDEATPPVATPKRRRA